MDKVTQALMLNAMKMVGKDVEMILDILFESLTQHQYEYVKEFLTWLNENNLTVGWGNIEDRLAQYEASCTATG